MGCRLMASENKKRKAKNSYIMNGAESQKGIKLKRVFYFTKANRIANRNGDFKRCCFKLK